jgi:hypothetical protein
MYYLSAVTCLHGPTTLLIVGLAKIYRKRPFKFLAVFPVHTQRPSGCCPGAGSNCQTKYYKIWLIRVGAARALIPEARDVFILQNAEDAYYRVRWCN